MHALLLFVHLMGVVVWLGGMAFAHFAMRPAAVQTLEPPMRLPFLAAALGRFFRMVLIAIVAVVGSGLAIMLPVGMARSPLGWHLMLGLGLVMVVVFAFVYGRLYPQLRGAVAAAQWPAAGATMNRIRQWVFLNLCLGALTVAAAASARAA